MNEKRKPEWTPLYSGKEFATSVVTGKKSVHIKASPSTKGKKYDLDTLVKGVLNSERTLLAKAITLIESNAEKHFLQGQELIQKLLPCLLYTSDAADDLLCVDLGGRRIIKKKT